MKLTVAIITKDRYKELERAIHSCIKQNFDDMEFVIIDNGSSDKTIEYLKNLSIKKLKIYLSDKNLGVSGGRNLAMSLSQGEYIFFLDDDAVIETQDLFVRLCRYLDDNENIGALALKVYEEITERYLIGPLQRNNKKQNEVNTLHYIGCAHVIRRAIFNNNKLYPSKLGYGSEELYASLRIWKRGFIIKYFDDVYIRHIPSSSNRLNERERQYNILLNMFIVKMLIYPLFFRIIACIIFLIRLIKNRYFNFKTLIKLYKDLKYRYQKSEIDRISVLKLIKIGCDFSWAYIL